MENTSDINPAPVDQLVGPVRIQLSRKKGFRKPEGAIVVARPSRWGNQFRLDQPHPVHGWPMSRAEAVECFRRSLIPYTHQSNQPMVEFLLSEFSIREIQRELRGKDLCCWCPIGEPCHADVLLELANGPLV